MPPSEPSKSTSFNGGSAMAKLAYPGFRFAGSVPNSFE